MQQLKTYLAITVDFLLLGYASLAEIDAELRIVVIFVGLVLTVFTIVKVYYQIEEKKINNRFRRAELKEKEEQVRRFFEDKHKDDYKQLDNEL